MRPISKSYDGRREQYENPAPKGYLDSFAQLEGDDPGAACFCSNTLMIKRAGSHLKRLLNCVTGTRIVTGRGVQRRTERLWRMSPPGPSRHFAAMRNLVAIGAKADSGQPNALKIYGFTA
jgi:hypothetical protein